MRRLAPVLVLAASCVSVADEHRCGGDADCVLGGEQGRCEPTGYCSFADDTCGTGGFRYHERTAAPGVCVLPLSPVTIEGISLDAASDRIASPCAPAGAREIEVELTIPIPQTVQFDSIGAAVALALHTGGCPARGAPLGCVPPNTPCGAIPYGRLAGDLPPGTYCLVVEEADPAATTTLTLRSLPAGRVGRAITAPGPITGNTCMDPRSAATAPTCSASTGPEASFILALCPQQMLQVVALDPAPFDTVLFVGNPVPAQQAGCSNAPGANVGESVDPIAGLGPFWIIVDGADPGQCGPFSLNVAF